MPQYVYAAAQSQPTIAGGTGPYALYVSSVNKTFFCYQGRNLRPVVQEYDHSAGTVSAPVEVSTNSLSNDDHGAPGIARRSDGYLEIFWGTHNGQTDPGGGQPWAISDNPDDISSWTEQTAFAVGDGPTYNTPVYTANGRYLIARTDADQDAGEKQGAFYKWTGSAWSARTEFVDYGTNRWFYHQGFAVDSNGDIHLVGIKRIASTGETCDPWHLILRTADDTIDSIDGTQAITQPLNEADMDAHAVIEQTDDTINSAWPVRIGIDENDDPHIVYAWSDGTNHEIRYAQWGGTAWSITKIVDTPTADHNPRLELIVRSSTDMDVFVPAADYQSFGRHHNDGTGFSATAAETINVPDAGWPKLVRDATSYEHAPRSDFETLFCSQDNEDYGNNDLEVYAWGNGSFLQGPRYSREWDLNPSADAAFLEPATGADLVADSTVHAASGFARIDGFSTNDGDFSQCLIAVQDPSDGDGWALFVGDDNLASGFSKATILGTFGGNTGVQSITGYTTGEWVHWYALFDQSAGGAGSSECRVVFSSLGGSLGDILDTGKITVSDTSTATGARISLGNRDGGTRGLGGLLSDVILLSTEPTDTELSDHLALTAANEVWSSYISYWPLNGGDSPEPDVGGNGNDLTLSNVEVGPVSAFPAPVNASGTTVTGTGSPQAQDATATGIGERIITGTASVQADPASASGTDTEEALKAKLQPGVGYSRFYSFIKG